MNFYSNLPSIDLHGLDRITAIIQVREFLEDYYKLGYERVVIIHGIGTGVLRKAVSDYLAHEKHVLDYKVDFMNPGCTVVTFKRNS